MKDKERAVKYFKNQILRDVGGQGYSRFYYYDLAIESLEKQIPKKPIEKASNLVEDGSGDFICPVCNGEVGHFNPKNAFWRYVQQDRYCKNCGQIIDWDSLL